MPHISLKTGKGRLKAGQVVFSIVVLGFLVLPIAAIIPVAFSSGSLLSYPLPGLSLKWFYAILQPYPWRASFVNSLLIASVATVLSTALGTAAAYALMSMRAGLRSVILSVLLLPMIVPIIISALAFYFLFSWVNMIGTFSAIVFAHTILALPFVVIAVGATLSRFDTGLFRAALTLGCTSFGAFRQVVLPIIIPGVLSGAVFAFTTSFDEVIVAQFIGGPEQMTLPRVLFAQLREQLDPSIVAVASVLFAISCALMLAFQRLERKEKSVQSV